MAWLSYLGGIALLFGTTVSLLKVMIVPRRAWSIVASPSLAAMVWFFHGVARRMKNTDLADRWLGFLGPLYIVVLSITFLGLYTLGFAALLAPHIDYDWPIALREAGSSVFTLGFQSTGGVVPSTVDILAAATGMIVIALFIAYLPTLYTAIKERERFVKQVQGRLIELPVSGPNLLASHFERGTDPMLTHLYREGERWAAGVADTHGKYPVLLHFRAPRSPVHWLDTMESLADAAALQRALLPESAPPETRAVLDSIVLCLGDLAHTAGCNSAAGVTETQATGDAVVMVEEASTRLQHVSVQTVDDPAAVGLVVDERAGYRTTASELSTAIAAHLPL